MMTEGREVNAFCKMCPTWCGINVEVESGRAVYIRPNESHPYKRLCPKSAGLMDVTYSEDRITSPLRRVNGRLEEISWDEAYKFIGGKLRNIKEEDGGRGVAFHLGNPFIGTVTEKMARRFADVYGSPNYTSGASFCYYSRKIAFSLTFDFGSINALPSFHGTKCMILWGANPKESSFLQNGIIRLMRGRGAKLGVIDPRRTSHAKEADIHAQIRPGTDAFLALSMINVIIQENLYDENFVRNWTVGFDKLSDRAKEYSPEKAEEVTWVPAETIRDMARMYATNSPALISVGISPDHSGNGVQSNRALAILIAITGNIDKIGGNLWPNKLGQRDLRVMDMAPDEDEGVGKEYPAFNQISRERSMMSVLDAMLTGEPYPIKALIIQGTNPMLVFPDSNMTEKALRNLDLLVAIDIFMTKTASMADIILPACFALESDELRDYTDIGMSMTAYGQRAIDPVGQSIPDWRIWANLGKEMGYQEHFPWVDSDTLFEYVLEPTGFTLEQVKEIPGGIMTRPEQLRYLKTGFNTPSGKVELYSETLENLGYDPLPSFKETLESPEGSPELAEEYPLILITGARVMAFTHTQHRNIPGMLKRNPEPFVEINHETAGRLNIRDGERVAIKSPRGSIQMTARVTDDIHPKVVSIPHGWEQANANLLTQSRPDVRDPISGYPPLRTGLCSVNRI
ncbi:MAG: molybdopterin-dependent oxidoreductase [Desulfatiglans sp.]|jgi:anaerobic selenocysteine-containing dehydrogenase|nr:molybdopterin-dependent oxidoreductase [Desulfatiglans sp.]